MRVLSERELAVVLGSLAGTPRVVAGGNYATPWRALAVLDGSVARYRLFALNAQAGMPDRDGVTFESPFVGPGMRGHGRLRYFPGRLSLVPALLATALPPDVVLVQTSVPWSEMFSDGVLGLARPTSWPARCTRRAVWRSSRCRPGIRRRTCRPWCPGSTVR